MRCDHFHVNSFGSDLFNLRLETSVQTFEHRASAGQYDVVVEISTDIDVALLDGLKADTLNGIHVLAVHLKWLEEVLGASESFGSDRHDLAIWQLVLLLE